MDDEQKKARMAAITQKVTESMSGRIGQGSDDHGFGENENDKKKERISKDRWMERRDAEASAREAKREQEELFEQEKFHRESEEQEARWAEAEAHMVDEDEVKEKFEDEFPGLWSELQKNPGLFKKMNTALDLEFAGSGADILDWRVYDRVGQQFNERLEKMRENPDAAAKLHEREDIENSIAHKNLKQIERDNVYFNASFRPDGPADPAIIQEAFAADYEDVVRSEKAYKEATAVVDDIIHEEGEEAGSNYSSYQKAGNVARTRNALRDMAEGRAQDPDSV
jgi:hypothetical protein